MSCPVVSIWKDWAYTALLLVSCLIADITGPLLHSNTLAVEGPVISGLSLMGERRVLAVHYVLVEVIYCSHFFLSVRRKGNTPVFQLLSERCFRREGFYYNVSSLLKCAEEVLHEAGQQAWRLICRWRPASGTAILSPSHAQWLIFVIKGKCMVLQAESKSIQVLAKGRAFFSFLFSSKIIFFLDCRYIL